MIGSATSPRRAVRALEFESGLRVSLDPSPVSPLVSCHLCLSTGSAADPPARRGLAHFCEHLLLTGENAAKASGAWWRLEAEGGEITATTHHDRIGIETTVQASCLGEVLDLEQRRLSELPELSRSSIERHRQVLLHEVGHRMVISPRARALEALQRQVTWPGHPYHEPPVGDVHGLAEIDEGSLESWFAGHCRPQNATLALCGGFSIDAALDALRSCFGDGGWIDDQEPPDPSALFATEPPRPTAIPSIATVWDGSDGRAGRLLLGWPGPGWAAAHYLEDVVSLCALAETWRSSPLSHLERLLSAKLEVGWGFLPMRYGGTAYLILEGLALEEPQGLEVQLAACVQEALRTPLSVRDLERSCAQVALQESVRLSRLGAQCELQAVHLAFRGRTVSTADWLAAWAGARDLSVEPRDPSFCKSGEPLGEGRPSAGAAAQESSPLAWSSIPKPFRTQLGNQLSLEAVRWPSTRAGYISLNLPAGVLYEPEGRQGLAALTANLLLSRLRDSREALPRDVGDDSVLIGARASHAHLTVEVDLTSGRLARTLSWLSDQLESLRAGAGAFERAGFQLELAAREEASDPATKAELALLRALYGPTAFGRSVLGTQEARNRLRPADVESFWRQGLTGTGSSLVLVGPWEDQESVACAQQCLGKLPKGQRSILPLPPFRYEPRRLILDAGLGNVSVVRLGLRPEVRSGRELSWLRLLVTVLTGGLRGRLNQELRSRLGIAYQVRGGVEGRGGLGFVSLSTTVPCEQVAATLEVVRDSLDQLGQYPVGDDELRAAHNRLSGLLERLGQTARGQAFLCRARIGPDVHVRRQVDARDLLELAAQHLQFHRASIVVAGSALEPGGRMADFGPWHHLGSASHEIEPRIASSTRADVIEPRLGASGSLDSQAN